MSDHIDLIHIHRKRGDNHPIQFTIKDDAVPPVAINIAGFSFRLVVDPENDPADAANNILDLAGVLTDAGNGVVEFQPTAVQMDITPDTYFHEVQMIDGSTKIRTVVEGKFIIDQDIAK